MVIQSNISAMSANRYLGLTTNSLKKNTEKLSSGYKINRAADNAAGLSISEKMRKQIRGLSQASANAEDGISLIQTADGALEEVTEMLQRMNELCVQAANGTNSSTDRGYIQDEIDQLKAEIDRTSTTTKFNESYLLDGSLGRSVEKLETTIEIIDPTDSTDGTNGVDGSSSDVISEDELKKILRDEIVPHAVNALLETFPQAFGGLSDKDVTIGLEIYDADDSKLASVSSLFTHNTVSVTSVTYTLNVNLHYFKNADGEIELTDEIRSKFEGTMIHEMMHGMMNEAVQAGMFGVGADRFPLWFIEGMAQTTIGGCYNGNDFVNGGLGIREDSTDAEIIAKITSGDKSLASDTTTGNYGTGYLACMYLGYLTYCNTNGVTSVDDANLRDAVANGVDTFLKKLADNNCNLSDTIKECTNDKYTDLDNFKTTFSDADSIAFIKQLIHAADGSGTGGLVPQYNNPQDFYEENGFLPDTKADPIRNLFKLDVTNRGLVPDIDDDKNGSDTKPGKEYKVDIKKTYKSNGYLSLQIGSETSAPNKMIIYIDAMNCKSIGVLAVDVKTEDNATASIDIVADALKTVSTQRSKLGAYQNRLEHAIKNLDNIVENTTASESQIRDTDMNTEMVAFSNNSILAQAGQSMLAQANQINQGVLSLLAA